MTGALVQRLQRVTHQKTTKTMVNTSSRLSCRVSNVTGSATYELKELTVNVLGILSAPPGWSREWSCPPTTASDDALCG
jgi:hypothetical protein